MAMKSFWSVLFDERYSQLDPDQASGAAPGGRARQTPAPREQA